MAQTLPPFCPQCGTPTVEGQRFCAKCGLKSDVEPSPPPLAPPVKKRGPGRVGWISIILLLLIALGLGGYFAVMIFGLNLPGIGGGTGTQPPVTTTPINSTATYTGIDITVVNAQQSQIFVDDPNTSTDGMVRLN